MIKVNRTAISGNLGQDAELHFFNAGNGVLNCSVAIDDSWFDKNKNEYVQRTIWMPVKRFFSADFRQKNEELAAKLLKGTQVYVEGRLSKEEWTDKATNQPREKIIMMADLIQTTDRPRSEGGGNYGGGQASNSGGRGRSSTGGGWGESSNGGGNQNASAPAGNDDGGGEEIPF